MPGKIPANRAGKDSGSSNSSAELTSAKASKYSIWPKWTDDELVPDKRESNKPTGGDAGSRARKGTVLSPGQGDIDKGVEDDILPPSLKKGSNVYWVKPGQFILAPRTPTVVAEPIPNEIDLISENSHLLKSELMCSIISQLLALWHNRECLHLTGGEPDGPGQEWRPWGHIQHRKDNSIPMLNPQGTYGVKIFWMGAWRKITVTDNLAISKKSSGPKSRKGPPAGDSAKECDDNRKEAKGDNKDGEKENFENSEVLLPSTANTCELWPIILTKAILKVAALDYKGGSEWREFGDSSVIHMLTGWCPQTLTTRIESDVLWEVLCQSLPLWKGRGASGGKGEPQAQVRDEGEGGREGGNEGRREGEKVKMVTAQFTSAANGKPLTRAKETMMAESLEILRGNGVVSEKFDPKTEHAQVVFVSQVRDIPLQPPPKVPPPIPAPEEHAWLGYSRRRREPWKGPSPKPHPPRWVEVITPFATTKVPATSSAHNLEEVKEEEEKEEKEGEGLNSPEGEAGTEATGTVGVADGCGDASGTDRDDGEELTEEKGIWMKFEDFRKAFSSVEVYTPPSQFRFTRCYRDMTATVEMVAQEETKAKGRASHSPANKLKGMESTVADDTNILFIEKSNDASGGDSGEIELHFVFSCLSNWREGSKDLRTERKKSTALQKRRESILSNPLSQRYSFNYSLVRSGANTSAYAWAGGRAPPLTIPEADEEDSSSGSAVYLPPTPPSPEDEEKEEGEKEEGERVVVGGVLVVEEFNWRSISTSMPLLRLVTSGVKGAIVKVHRSKKLMKFHVKAPVGYHLSISSNDDFVLYNESAAYDRMHKEGIGYSKVYSGPVPPLPPNSWAVVFREVLQVRRDQQLLAFSLDCPVPGHQLRVVDNDDGREMPRVAHITEPREYNINKKGYTILCEMWTRSDPVVEGNMWKLRVISSDKDLPLCEGLEKEDEGEEEEVEQKKNEEEEEKNKEGGAEGGGEKEGENVAEVAIGTEFHHKEVREYCLPDRDSVLFRYSLRAKTECPITAQLTTSKKDAFIKLEILQGSEFDGNLVAVTQGRAYCFVPSFFLTPSPSKDADTPTNKFVMVATVLHQSWPFADTAWPYIDEIRSAEEEKSTASGSAGGGGGKGKKPPSASSKSGSGAKPKKGKGGGKDGGGKDGSDGVNSSLSLSNIDGSKPHWTLRVAIRQRDRDQFEMGRDTEREDELKSMQTTWETQQPGRLKQGQESRQKFLDAHSLKPPNTNSEDQQHVSVPSTPSLSTSTTPLPVSPSLLPPHAPIPLERIDLSLYTRNSNTTPHVLTAEERERRDEERKESIHQYRAWRRSVLESRDQDRQFRNSEKLRQLKEAEKQQTELEATRKRMNRGREKIRQAYLAEEKARREAEAAAPKTAEEDAAASNPRDSKKKGKKK